MLSVYQLLLLSIVVATGYTLFKDRSPRFAFSWLTSWTQGSCKVNSNSGNNNINESRSFAIRTQPLGQFC